MDRFKKKQKRLSQIRKTHVCHRNHRKSFTDVPAIILVKRVLYFSPFFQWDLFSSITLFLSRLVFTKKNFWLAYISLVYTDKIIPVLVTPTNFGVKTKQDQVVFSLIFDLDPPTELYQWKARAKSSSASLIRKLHAEEHYKETSVLRGHNFSAENFSAFRILISTPADSFRCIFHVGSLIWYTNFVLGRQNSWKIYPWA